MKRLLIAPVVVASVCLAKPLPAAPPEGKTGLQTQCPIMGGKIDRKVFTEQEGKRVYFCCSSCPEEFRKDPAKHINEMESQGVVLERSP